MKFKWNIKVFFCNKNQNIKKERKEEAGDDQQVIIFTGPKGDIIAQRKYKILKEKSWSKLKSQYSKF